MQKTLQNPLYRMLNLVYIVEIFDMDWYYTGCLALYIVVRFYYDLKREPIIISKKISNVARIDDEIKQVSLNVMFLLQNVKRNLS